MLKQRFVEILLDGEWQIRTFAALKKGMIFKIFEPDGEMIQTPDGTGELLATNDVVKEGDEYLVDFVYNNK